MHGAAGVALGFPLANPVVGLLISLSIFVLLIGTVRRRLLDAIDPTRSRPLNTTSGARGRSAAV